MRLYIRSLVVALVATAACKGTEPLLPAPTTITISPAGLQFGSVNTARQLTAQVFDQHGDPFPSAQLTWSTANTAVANVSAAGVVTSVGGGSTQVTATSGHASSSITVTVAQVPASIAKSAGDGQTGLQTFAVNVPPAVIVRDSGGTPIPGVQVTFTVTGGGGSVTGATPLSGANGVATVGSWTVQSGANTLGASVATSGVTNNPLSFGATGVAGTYNVEVRFLTSMSPARQAVFDSAAARWGRLIYGDVPDIDVSGANQIPAGACGSNSPAVNEVIDDVVIFATLDSIDGPGNILGQAGPCYIRLPGYLPLLGLMRFDTADVATYEGRNQFDEIVMHEMGHVLGYGTIWGSSYLNLLVGPASQGGTDPHFVGTQAIAAFNQIGGTGYTAGAKVPVENTGGAGTRDSHWRESVFGEELMTGFLGALLGPKPLSLVTVASMGDEGYQVNYAGADAFSLSFPAAALRAQAPGIQMKDDILKLPIRIVDRQGRLLRVVMPQ